MSYYGRGKDPKLIPRGEVPRNTRPGAAEAADLWDLCGTGLSAGVWRLAEADMDDASRALEIAQGPWDPWPEVDARLSAKVWLRRWLPELSEREALVIRRRYVDGWTLRRTGDEIGLSTERVRQIQARAIRRLRRLAGISGLVEVRRMAERNARCRWTCPYYRQVSWEPSRRGPDGRGRNRLRIEDVGPWMPHRCLLRPGDLRALWAGLERPRSCEPTMFGACDNEAQHTRCMRLVRAELERGAQAPLCVRVAEDGRPWLLNRPGRGWGEFGKQLRGLDRAAEALAGAHGRLRLRRDAYGELVEVSDA